MSCKDEAATVALSAAAFCPGWASTMPYISLSRSSEAVHSIIYRVMAQGAERYTAVDIQFCCLTATAELCKIVAKTMMSAVRLKNGWHQWDGLSLGCGGESAESYAHALDTLGVPRRYKSCA